MIKADRRHLRHGGHLRLHPLLAETRDIRPLRHPMDHPHHLTIAITLAIIPITTTTVIIITATAIAVIGATMTITTGTETENGIVIVDNCHLI